MKHFTLLCKPWQLWMVVMAALLPVTASAEVTDGSGDDYGERAYIVLSDNNTHLTFYYEEWWGDDDEGEGDEDNWGYAKGEQPFERPVKLKKGDSVYPLDDYNGLDPEIAKQVKTVTFDYSFVEAKPTTTENWFKGMTNLVSIEGIAYLNTENVENMRNMFRECSSLKSVDVSGFNTAKVSNMDNMFYQCSKLEKLDLSGFDMKSIGTHTDFMTANCTSLRELKINHAMKSLSDKACSGVGSRVSPCLLVTPEDYAYGFDPTGASFEWKGGTFRISDEEKNRVVETLPYMLLSENQQQVTFIYNNKWKFSPGTIYKISEKAIDYYPYDEEDWSGTPEAYMEGYQGLEDYIAAKVKKAVFDPSFAKARPGHTVKWFANMKNLKTIEGMQYLNTSNVWSLERMFMRCADLTAIDLSHFNTEEVMSINSLFEGCSSLKTIDLSHFNAKRVMQLNRLFYGCSSLTTIDISHFDFNVIGWEEEGSADDPVYDFSANGVFQGCTNLKTLSISSDMQKMSEDACKGVGTTKAPCTLLIPDDFLLGVDPYGDCFVWREGVFQLSNEMKEKDKKMVIDYVIHSGNQLTFYHDNKKRAKSGDLYGLDTFGGIFNDWYDHPIVFVSFDASFAQARPTSTKGWFEGMNNLCTIEGWQYLNTSKVTNMANMFKGCSNLSMVDVSNFDTSKTTDMTAIFQGCKGLEVMKIGNGMSKLPADACQGVGTAQSPCLIASPANFNFGTSTNSDFTWKSGFFTISEEGRPIEEYVVQSGNRKNVTFYRDKLKRVRKGAVYGLSGYEGLERTDAYHVRRVTIDPSFAEAKPTSAYGLFANMEDVTRIDGLEYLNTSEVTNMSRMFYRCISLNTLDLSHFDTSKVTDMSEMFYYCSKLDTLDLSNFDTSNVTTMLRMFADCSSLNTLDLSHFKTSKVTDMSGTFMWCSSLNTLDLSNFDTSNVTDMSGMFDSCRSLNTLDLSHFDISNMEEEEDGDGYGYYSTRCLLSGCSNLKELAISLSMSHLYEEEYWWYECESACDGVGTKRSPCFLHVPEGFDFGNVNTASNSFQWKGGWFRLSDNSAYAQLSEDGKTMTFYYDKQKMTRTGTVYDLAEYNGLDEEQAKLVTKVVFDKSFAEARPDSTSQWFYGMTKLTTLQGMENLNTSKVTSMFSMFQNCSSLTAIDLSHFDTSNVTSMRSLFYGCKSLKALDLSNFDTSKVDNMRTMFYNCAKLTSLDLSMFDTSNVTSMYYMFSKCDGLTSLDLSNFETSKVETMYAMFSGCSELSSLNLGGRFNTSNVNTMYCMFNKCFNLTSLDLSNFDTSNVETMYGMFSQCTKLTSLDLGGFNTSKVKYMQYMFNSCTSLESIDVSSFNTSNVKNMEYMFNECTALKSLNLSYFDFSKATSTKGMMDNCHNLDTLAINTTMGNLSENACNKVGTDDKPCVILAPWGFDFGVDTSKGIFNWKSGFFQLAPESPYALVSEDERIMTFYFDNLVTARRGKTHDIGKYEGLDENDATKVTKVVFDPSFANVRPKSTYRWFYRMSNLMTIEGMKNLNTSEVTNMRAMFNDCSSLQIIDLSHFDTSSATTMHNLFNGCTNLISLDVKGFDTSKVTDMYAMFNNCKSLTSLDVSGFNTAKVKTMYAIFNNCSGLASLDVSKFNTSSVTTTRAMFKECTSLKNLDISNFDMSKVTNSELMFDNCRNLETFHISSTMDNLNEEACRGVGTQENPCVLICPKDFNFGNVIPERTFKWKLGYFTIPDGIAPTTIDNADSTDQPIYNLQGIRVLSSKRGIYIRNGKKVMVK